eukprot:CAMPEP_0194292874 /NCGR_PEP_ID=MMETSP0169-20130528/46663_1 /TAXON_ID=218684 /ORGANISM="Corethron pennatum, Strain L29A3" /LENGTH=519 /DNA_ID=CAMNT_0039041205 /DNA_START=79 /DNA_END=1638 /DNA_ORIENTATION=-
MLLTHRVSPQNVAAGAAALPQLTVLSYNILMPNSSDGWWTYKMYNPPVAKFPYSTDDGDDDGISSWPYRRSRLESKLRAVDADVVCMQEVSPDSFVDDFSFMKLLGYDRREMYKKGRMRPATFWKSCAVELVEDGVVHGDRTLLTSFRVVSHDVADTEFKEDAVGSANKILPENNTKQKQRAKGKAAKKPVEQCWHVVNCHLQAGGREGPRRLRQILGGVQSAVKFARKRGESDPTSPRLIVCGDFNGSEDSAAVSVLTATEIGPDYLEDGRPVTSKLKHIATTSGPLVDVSASAGDIRPPPPTLVVSELISLMADPSSENDEGDNLTDLVVERLKNIYDRYATVLMEKEEEEEVSGRFERDSRLQMGTEDVERWLVDINGRVGRGTEFRNAAKAMGWTPPPPKDGDEDGGPTGMLGEQADTRKKLITLPPRSVLTFRHFVDVYTKELRGGKFWGICHDLAVMGEALPDAGLFTGRYDRMYCTSNLCVNRVYDTISDRSCPNDDEPSDHLPVAATFGLK